MIFILSYIFVIFITLFYPLCIEHNIQIYPPFVKNLTQLWGVEWNCPHIHHHSSLIIATWKTLDASWWLRWGWRALQRWCRRWCPRLSEGFRWAASEPGPASRISLRCRCQCSDFRCIQQRLICNRSYWLSDRWWSNPQVSDETSQYRDCSYYFGSLVLGPEKSQSRFQKFCSQKGLILRLENFGLKKVSTSVSMKNMVLSLRGVGWPLQLSDCTVLLQISSARRRERRCKWCTGVIHSWCRAKLSW